MTALPQHQRGGRPGAFSISILRCRLEPYNSFELQNNCKYKLVMMMVLMMTMINMKYDMMMMMMMINMNHHSYMMAMSVGAIDVDDDGDNADGAGFSFCCSGVEPLHRTHRAARSLVPGTLMMIFHLCVQYFAKYWCCRERPLHTCNKHSVDDDDNE
eukprot:6460414-Amphidinium_carterae.1